MKPESASFQRWFVGGAAVACFFTAAVLGVADPDEPFWWGGFLRAGIVCVALWACLPTRSRPAAWADFKPWPTALLVAAVLLAIIRPKVGLPLLFVALFVRWLSNLRRPTPRRTRDPQRLFD